MDLDPGSLMMRLSSNSRIDCAGTGRPVALPELAPTNPGEESMLMA